MDGWKKGHRYTYLLDGRPSVKAVGNVELMTAAGPMSAFGAGAGLPAGDVPAGGLPTVRSWRASRSPAA